MLWRIDIKKYQANYNSYLIKHFVIIQFSKLYIENIVND